MDHKNVNFIITGRDLNLVIKYVVLKRLAQVQFGESIDFKISTDQHQFRQNNDI